MCTMFRLHGVKLTQMAGPDNAAAVVIHP